MTADVTIDLECIVARNQYGRYCIPASSGFRHCSTIVAGGNVFEPKTIEFLARHIGQGDIIHAGAFFGDFLPALSRAAAPGALIWAFEPSRENYICAAITAQLNELTNVRLRRAGLGAASSTAHMHVADSNGRPLGEESFISDRPTESGSESVEIVSLDDVIPTDRHVSLLQLDVEGYEEPALTGALKLIERCKPILVLETVPSAEWVARHLEPLGYKVRAGVHANTVMSAQPVASPLQHLRLMARNWLKRVVPNKIRRRYRAMEAQHLGRHSSAEDWSKHPPFLVEDFAYKLRTQG